MTDSACRSSGGRFTGLMMWLVCGMLAGAVASAPAGAQQNKQAPKASAAAEGATYVGMETCLGCHENKAGDKTLHNKAVDPRTPAGSKGCESCHGPGSKHADDPEKVKPIQFDKVSALQASAQCTGCHTTGQHTFWTGSKHESRRVSCVSCHSVHSPKGEKQLKAESQTELCATCHQATVNKVTRFNHMPVREDKLACASCHNVHGSDNVKLLRAGTNVVEACTSCHQEKRGPVLFEHSPVTGSCTTCHDAHGSSNDRMLVAKLPFLCQRCHVSSRHPAAIHDSFEMNNSYNGNKTTGRACMNCHQQIHGSNSPNGKAFIR